MTRRPHARPMSEWRRARTIHAIAYHAAEAVVFVACVVSIFMLIWTAGG